ncbi:MAG: DNA polymerase III subunit chi [Acetobacter sp.]|jgi:DNA polymerase-3 subunit chi
MAAYAFYHLMRGTAENALAALLGRTLDAGQRAVIMVGDSARMNHLDDALWKISDPLWLPHGASGCAYPERQPIWLTDGCDVPNGARYLFLMNGRSLPENSDFERIFDVFDGQDEAEVSAARERWRQAQAGGHDLAYWKQENRGWKRAR